MRQYQSATLVAAVVAALAATPMHAQQPGGGMRMGGGKMGASGDSSTMAMMRLVHEMMMNHDKIRRTVTNLPDGVRTVTESDDAGMQRILREHVATTGELVRTSHDPDMPMETPALRAVLRNGAKISRTVTHTPTGVIVTETSTDAATVALVQRHAAEVTDLVNRGMAAMHEAMMQRGGMSGGMGAGMGGMHGAMGGGGAPATTNAATSDSAFAAVQARGKLAMGVDQYASTHRFDALPDGGRIELQRDVDDPAGIATIRAHLQDIATAFGSGDFRTPAFVHRQEVPGARVMAAKRSLIRYTVTPLPRGAALRITTTDPEAVAAIAQFMAFQRMDHRAH